jgi:hypothetical protein
LVVLPARPGDRHKRDQRQNGTTRFDHDARDRRPAPDFAPLESRLVNDCAGMAAALGPRRVGPWAELGRRSAARPMARGPEPQAGGVGLPERLRQDAQPSDVGAGAAGLLVPPLQRGDMAREHARAFDGCNEIVKSCHGRAGRVVALPTRMTRPSPGPAGPSGV